MNSLTYIQMRPTFECQVITHRNEMVTGVLFKENVDRNQEKKLDYLSFPQIIDQLEDEAHALKQYLVEENKKIVSLITEFECLRKQCGQIISDYEKSIDLMNLEQFADPLVRQMIQGLKKKRPHELKELATKYHLENRAISLWEIKQHFQEDQLKNMKKLCKNIKNRKQIEDSQDQDEEDFQSLINLGTENVYKLNFQAPLIQLISVQKKSQKQLYCFPITAKKKYQKALEYFDQAIIMDQNNFAPYFEKGIVLNKIVILMKLRKQQQYHQALLFLEKAKNKLTSPDEIPDSLEIDYQIGIILIILKQKKIKEAFALFDVLIERNPVYEEPYFAKIKHLWYQKNNVTVLQKQELEQAILCCNSLLKKCENSKIGNFYRGLILDIVLINFQNIGLKQRNNGSRKLLKGNFIGAFITNIIYSRCIKDAMLWIKFQLNFWKQYPRKRQSFEQQEQSKMNLNKFVNLYFILKQINCSKNHILSKKQNVEYFKICGINKHDALITNTNYFKQIKYLKVKYKR